ncbi:MAG: four helix bundle protein [Acidobacteriota bacterium]|nr:four helix bundle protein [Acidobacteriota bacterium]
MDDKPKPYDIKDRVFLFACATVSAFPKSHLDTPSLRIWSQLISAATSSGAHLEEAAAGGSRAHFLSLTRGGLREMREANYWLRVMVETKLAGYKSVSHLVSESSELKAILTTIVKNTVENDKKGNRDDKA